MLEDFLIEFNKLNSKFKHENTRTLMMDIIKPKDFIEEVKAFARVKEVYVEYPLLENNNNLISQLEEMSKNKGLKDVDTIKISYRTTVRGGSVRSVDKFFDKILEDDKLNIGISGTLPSNRNKTIQKLASRLTQTFDINVSVNSNGLESFEDLSEEMTRINRFEDLVPEINSGNAVKIELEKVGDISYEETEKRA
ncbi:TPA: hypothetical protein H9348_002905 [Listeria monocytogenes]|nr:hypothetical protein [Listeria monocytogenes]EAE7418223.1 hypothetical protein [Listeria monocytogenes]EGP8438112.1 hypothetical protein [Listeria monocytogenes]EGP9885180.1 hypothetical protein [Listeria monocytogenes]EKA3504946.1 hypothetical protein [Listeria monocytogenes]